MSDQAPQAERKSNWSTYRNEEHGFTIEAPSDWTAVPSIMAADIAFLEPEDPEQRRFRANVNVIVGSRDPVIGSLADQCLANIEQLSDVLTSPELLDAGPVVVERLDERLEGHRVLVTYLEGRDALTMEQWYWPMSDNRVGVVTATVTNDRFAANAPGFEHMANSLVG